MSATSSVVRNLLLALAALPLLAQPALAELVVDRIEVDLVAEEGWRSDVAVTNDSPDETVYVQVDVFQVLNPGTQAEERVESKSPEDSGLLASPRQLVLAPGQTKLVRLLATEPPGEIDKIFRVQVYPVVGDILAEGMVLKVVIGYDMLVMVRPDGGAPQIVGERQGKTLVLHNEGNSTGYLLSGKNCDATGTTCENLPNKRMYPGNSFTVDLPFDGPVTYDLGVGLSFRGLAF